MLAPCNEAATENPDALIKEGEDPSAATSALWTIGDVVMWLVVEPQQ